MYTEQWPCHMFIGSHKLSIKVVFRLPIPELSGSLCTIKRSWTLSHLFMFYILVSFWLEDSAPSSQPQPENAEQEHIDRDDDFTNGLLIRNTDYIIDWLGIHIVYLIDQGYRLYNWLIRNTDYIIDWSGIQIIYLIDQGYILYIWLIRDTDYIIDSSGIQII